MLPSWPLTYTYVLYHTHPHTCIHMYRYRNECNKKFISTVCNWSDAHVLSTYCMQCISTMRDSSALLTRLRYQAIRYQISVLRHIGEDSLWKRGRLLSNVSESQDFKENGFGTSKWTGGRTVLPVTCFSLRAVPNESSSCG